MNNSAHFIQSDPLPAQSNELTGTKTKSATSVFPPCPGTAVTEPQKKLGETSFVTKVRELVRRFL